MSRVFSDRSLLVLPGLLFQVSLMSIFQRIIGNCNYFAYLSSVFGTFVLVVTSHSLTVQSADPDASSDPSQLSASNDVSHHWQQNREGRSKIKIIRVKWYIHLKARDHTQALWPIKGVTQRPLGRSHIMIVPSSSPDAMCLPSGDIARDRIILLWPVKIRTHSPVRTSQSLTVLSLEPVAM